MAQRTKASYKTTKNTRFADNTTGLVTAANSRDMNEDIADSALFIEDNAYTSFVVTASGTNTYTATLSPAITSYATGAIYRILFTNANTAASTLNLNALGAKSIVKNGATALVSGDIPAGSYQHLMYDGTNLQIVGGISGNATTLTSGTYTPTLTNVSNLDASTAFVCQYMRVGSVVTVSGKVDIDPTAANALNLGISLPIASNFANAEQCGGCGNTSAATAVAGAIYGDTTNDRANLAYTAATTANHSVFFTFTYLIV